MASRRHDLRALVSGVDAIRVDWVLAVVLAVALQVQVWTNPHQHVRPAAAAVELVAAACVALRRRWLLPATAVATAVTVAAALAYDGQATRGAGAAGGLIALLLFYGGGAFLTGRRSLIALGLGVTLLSAIAASAATQVASNLLFDIVALAVLPWIVGRTVRERAARARGSRERAERLDADRDVHVQAAALGERTRLARELHDVIAHSVSVMVIQAAGARTVMDRDPQLAEGSLRSVERAGREALVEIRRLLGVLGDVHEAGALAPQPGIDDLGELIARTRAAGLVASMSVEGEPAEISPGLALCVYRVVQEALTNTLKHAGSANAAVSLRWLPDAIELEVVDDGPGRPSAAAGRKGHGIAGMRERAALHGGSVEAGPLPAGGFAVRARVPLYNGGAM